MRAESGNRGSGIGDRGSGDQGSARPGYAASRRPGRDPGSGRAGGIRGIGGQPAPATLACLDRLGAAALFAGGLIAYISTLAPTVLDGDAALFQYTPWVLGVTYPTGYPTYILLGRLWLALAPIGSGAFQMNLFSAVCGALALAFLYPTLRRLLESHLGALLAVLIFATLPTYWRWATEAKIYTLHIFLFSAILLFLCLSLGGGSPPARHQPPTGSQPKGEARARPTTYLLIAAVLFGLALGNHSTTLLLAPGLFLLFWLNRHSAETPYSMAYGRASPQASHISRTTYYVLRIAPYVLALVFIPVILYLYVPFRAEWLLAREGTIAGLKVPVAVARGLVADFYRSGLRGWVRYFTAADFTGGVATNWGLVPRQLVTVYWPLVQEDFSLWGAILGFLGAIYLAAWRPRRFWPLFLMYAILIPFVLTYGQGEQSAFLLPSSLMLATFCGAAVAGGVRGIRGWRLEIRDWGLGIGDWGLGIGDQRLSDKSPVSNLLIRLVRGILVMGVVAAVAWLPIRQAQENVHWLTDKWDDAAYQYWTDVLAHPMESGAGMLAHWGDLTSFWYLQHVEGLRPDLYGLYPPTEEMVVDWLAAGHDLYIAGPLQGWAAGVEKRYQLLPWGRLVRLAPGGVDPLALLPDLPAVNQAAYFDDRIRLLKAGFAGQATSGGVLPVTLAWRTTDQLPADAHVSLRLVAEDGGRAAQSDEALLSGWLAADTLPAGQVLLSFHRFKLPAGMLPGTYRLQIALFQPHKGEWSLQGGQSTLRLGQVKVTLADRNRPADPWGEYKPVDGTSFGGEIRLVGYDYSVTRAGQGKGFVARFLWQAMRRPAADYTLLVELVDADGKVRREWRHIPTDGRAPTSTWAAAQTVRDQIDLVIPADAPPGDDTLRVRLSLLRPDGSHLPARRWLLPAGGGITLPGVRVGEKEDRLFEPPPISHPTDANFDNKIRLIGYDRPATSLSPGDALPLTLFWQSLTSDMRESYTVFVHLVGSDGVIHGQWDKEPGARSKQPTTAWVTGEVVVDPISVPLSPDAPPGNYRVLVGLYLAPEGPRLPLRGASGQIVGDAFELTQIQVDD